MSTLRHFKPAMSDTTVLDYSNTLEKIKVRPLETLSMRNVIKKVDPQYYNLPKGLTLSVGQDSIHTIKTIWPFYQHFEESQENEIFESWKKILQSLKAKMWKTPEKLHLGFHYYASENFLRRMEILINTELTDIKNIELNYFTLSPLINISHNLNSLTHLKINNFRCKIDDKTFKLLGSTISRYLNELVLLDLLFTDWEFKLKNQSLETLAAHICRDLKKLKYLALTFEKPFKSANDWNKVRNCIYTCSKSLPSGSPDDFVAVRCGPKEKDGLVFDLTQSPKECTLKFTNSKTMNDQEIIAFSAHLSSYFVNLKHLKLNCSQLSANDLNTLQSHVCSMANLSHLYLSFRGSKDITDENVSELFLNISNSLVHLSSLCLTFRSCIKIRGKCLQLVGKKLQNEFMTLSKLVLDFSSCIWITEEEIAPLLLSISERQPKLQDSVLCFNGCYRVPSEAKAELKDMAALIQGLDITLFQERADWE